jgi:HAD superfamily hydrolase (TIGR01509 family)
LAVLAFRGHNLLMMEWEFTGRVTSGLGRGRDFTRLDWVRDAFVAAAGIDPFPGTLNLALRTAEDAETWQSLRAGPGWHIPGQAGACDARCFPARLAGRVPAAIVLPAVPDYPQGQLEIVAAVSLRRELGLADGDDLQVTGPPTGRLRAVVFDVDGTLVDSVDAYHIAAGRAAEPFGYAVTRAMVQEALNARREFWELVVTDPTERSDELVATLRRETMRHWQDVLHEHVRVFPGLRATLERLQAAGLRIAIFTGSRGESFAQLEAARLLELFEVVLTGADVADAKPHPAGLLRCLEALGVAPGEGAYVGDAVPDVGAAHAAGARAIGVLTGAADSAALTAAGAHWLAADHAALAEFLLSAAGGQRGR